MTTVLSEREPVRHAPAGLPDPDWYKRAVIYEVLVPAFQDSDGDGIGDLPGLTQRLDYLAWLGVTCLWLPPFYESPMCDGGYDVSDFRAIRPDCGTLDDFRTLLREAHARGIRVIVDMVMNHTSDRHPWFQASRREPDGPYGDYYVWADDDNGYPDARIIFVDTEASNWTYDPVRGQHYWHRFFASQPDLSYANPAVRAEMLDVMRFWLGLGVDGLRLDAVPYLFEADGTSCENLPETHAFLRDCRRLVDTEFPGRILLAEANQPADEVVRYFGEPRAGDECHMAFHFPLMPRLFAAVRMQDARPVSRVLAQTPPLPSSGQWGLFLRNHDELTLEMVDDEERAYLLSEYAQHPRMTANIGIRRRLAPLLDNDPALLRLVNALLLSLPGTPILYYGDEIGMGDNIWLADRDAVRCPMQWAPEPYGGFSTRDPAAAYLPLVDSPGFECAGVNVQAQLGEPDSLLHWTRRMIHVRHEYPVFGLGGLAELPAGDPAVLALLRTPAGGRTGETPVLAVHNFSASAREARVELPVGTRPRPLVPGPAVDGAGATRRITLPAYGFGWYALEPAAHRPAGPHPATVTRERRHPAGRDA